MKLQVFGSGDKIGHDDINSVKEHKMQFPRPFSMLIIGMSGAGKSNLVKNVIDRNHFEIIYLMHADTEGTKEYDDIDFIKYDLGEDYITKFNKFQDKHKCLIIDDINFQIMSKKTQQYFFKTLTYSKSHCNLSILCTCQDGVYYPPLIRRSFQIIVVYRYINLESLRSTIAFSIISKKKLEFAMKNLTKTDFDFILINGFTKNCFISIENKYQLLSSNTTKDYEISDNETDYDSN